MATWHQAKAGPIGPGRFSWYIVTDPPGEMRSVWVESTREAAEARVALWAANGVDVSHTYILEPKE